MPELQFRGRVATGQAELDVNIRALEISSGTDDLTVYAVTGRGGGVSAYRLDGGGRLRQSDTVLFDASANADLTDDPGLLRVGDGADLRLLVGGRGAVGVTTYATNSDGDIGPRQDWAGLAGGTGRILAAHQAETGRIYLADNASAGLRAYEQGANGRLRLDGHATEGSDGAAIGRITAIASLDLAGRSWVLGATPDRNEVIIWQDAGAGQFRQTGTMGSEQGLGVMIPVALETVVVEGTGYAILASAAAQGTSAAISVMRITPEGRLVPTDHVIDSLESRFGLVQSLETVSVGGRVYVLAGGGDDGLSLFLLRPDGQLQHLQSVSHDIGLGLEDVSAIAASAHGGRIEVVVAGEGQSGLTRFSLDISNQGDTLRAGPGGAVLTGGDGDNLVLGGPGNDTLRGERGDDILVDGAGSDRLVGGGGADIFVLGADGARDRIDGFEPGRDRIDLSGMPFYYGAAQLTYVPTGTGAQLIFRDEVLDIRSSDGRTLRWEDLHPALMGTPDRPPLAVQREAVGTSGADNLTGGWTVDVISGLAADDRISGREGDDRLFGGDGNDRLAGEADNDLIYGGDGFDTIYAGSGFDTVFGGNGRDRVFLGRGDDLFNDTAQGGERGRDTVFAEAGQDTIQGGNGDDEFHGQLGDDVIFGRLGDDLIFAGDGFDRVDAGDGNDTVFGGNGRDRAVLGTGDDLFNDNSQGDIRGRDTVFAGPGRDTIQGGNGDDEFHGMAGDDVIFARLGSDLVFGGDGVDTIDTGDGNDTVFGGNGRDRVAMGEGDDLFNDTAQGGERGRDTVFGGPGNDRVEGGNGDDEFHGMIGNDVIFGRLGSDLVFGGDGFDTIDTGDGNDTVFGGNGRDRVAMGNGDDLFNDNGQSGERGRDTVFAGPGNDRIEGGNGDDEFHGMDGDDVIFGRLGDDTIFGGAGADRLNGGYGRDWLTGGAGADIFVFSSGAGRDRILDFEGGQDRIAFDLPGLRPRDIDIRQVGNDILLDYGANSLRLVDIDMADLGPDVFLFT